ncbi:MAG TPA: MOSC domain-containing protein [Thermoplasmata archaeon]|nr:MOSC domain-containing protein [Thermoplasmata archaeon]
MRGRVFALHRKPEAAGERGLPKPSVPEVRLTPEGVVGDYNRYRTELLHSEPTSAVLLIPLETLEGLQSEGWPVQPGDLGENITTQGIPYDRTPPLTRVSFGGAEIEVTRPCDPCTNLYLLPYVGEERGPEFIKTMLHRRGWYCRVLASGVVRVGDPVEVAD